MISITKLFLGSLFFVASKCEDEDFLTKIPQGLSIGSAGAAYQIEGAWNVSDKGVSVWDWYTHNYPSRIFDRSNGDIACDSYRKYKQDVKLAKDLGFKHYRFSVSWSRILPTGFPNVVSKEGIKYYHDVLDEIEKNEMVPFVTLYHWDHPQTLDNLGGWTSELMIDWFADFARVVFRELGSRVKIFSTFNEPTVICDWGYADIEAPPGINMKGIADYICVHNALKAHARAYHIYDKEFRPQQNGTIGIIIPSRHHFAKYPNDSIAAEVAFQFDCGWTGHPIFSKLGDYPKVMKERIAENSKLQGWPRSRLPSFSQFWIDYIKGTSDYFGLNHYTSDIVESVPRENGTLWYKETGVMETRDPKWPDANSTWLKVAPEGFGSLLRKIKEEYGNPPVYVMENGLSDANLLDDCPRVNYFYSYMKEMLIAVNRDGCNVKAYTVWSLLDNFQWARGYTERFGIVHIDFNDPERKRTPKRSALWLKDVLLTGRLLPDKNCTS